MRTGLQRPKGLEGTWVPMAEGHFRAVLEMAAMGLRSRPR